MSRELRFGQEMLAGVNALAAAHHARHSNQLSTNGKG